MKKFTKLLFVFIITFSSAYGQTSYTLKYKYNKGDVIKYKTERHDSTASTGRGQSMEFKTTTWMLQSLNVKDINDKNQFVLALKTDSVWSDNEQMGKQARRMGRNKVQKVTIDSRGKSDSENPPQNLFFLQLPENPVSVNDEWDYEIHGKTKGRRAGETTVKVHCMLYGVEKQGKDDVAIIIVNTDSKSTGQFSFKRQDMSVKGTFASSGKGSALVYFNITKGIIQEIVAENNAESSTESSAFSSNMISKSKVSTKLIAD